jgi:ACS family phthalate transporter-like MFS transporter
MMVNQLAASKTTRTEPTGMDARLFRKLTWRIMPILFLSWVVNWIDRINIGFAHIGFQKDLHITEATFGIIVGVYAIGYLLLEIPSNLLMQKIGARLTLSRILLLWGIVTIATAFARTPTQFIVLRILLGAAEAGFFPGVILYLGYWFPSAYRARIMSRFILANAVSGIVGGPLAVSILGHMGNVLGMHAWQWLFILEGLPPIALGIILFIYLRDRPSEASWLTDAEKRAVQAALDADRQRHANTRHTSFLQAARDPRVLGLALTFCFSIMVCGNIVNIWAPSIIKQSGVMALSNLGWLSSLPYIVGVVTMFLVTWHSDVHNERRWHFAIPVVCAALGILLLPSLGHTPYAAIALLVVGTAGYLSATAVFWTIPSFYLSESARAGGIALINTVGQIGALVAPIVIGSLRTSTGSLATGLYIVAPVIIVGAAILVASLRPHMTRAQAQD